MKSPDMGVMAPHNVFDDPSLFSAVTLKVYLTPTFRSGIVTTIVSTLMSGMGWDLNYSHNMKQTHRSEEVLQCGCRIR